MGAPSLKKIKNLVLVGALATIAGVGLSFIPVRVTAGSITHIGPYHEVVRPIDYDYDLDDFSSDYSYEKRSHDIDQEIKLCQQRGQGSPRFKAWVDLIHDVSAIDDPLLKIQVVNGWVNEIVRYDKKGAQREQNPLIQDYQTPKETLDRGSGVCTDYATLKYETLKRAGIDPAVMRLIIGHIGKEGHMVMAVCIDGQNWILNNQSADPALYNNPNLRPVLFPRCASVSTDDDFLKSGFIPDVAENDQLDLYLAYVKSSEAPAEASSADPDSTSFAARLAAATPEVRAMIAGLIDRAFPLSGNYIPPANPSPPAAQTRSAATPSRPSL